MTVCRSEMSVALYSNSDSSTRLLITARDGGAVTFLINGESPVTLERFMYATEYKDAFEFIDSIVESLEKNDMSHDELKEFIFSLVDLFNTNYVQQNRLISIQVSGMYSKISDFIDVLKLEDIHVYLSSWAEGEFLIIIPEYQYHAFLDGLESYNKYISPDKIVSYQPSYFDSDEKFILGVLSNPEIGSKLLN